MKPEEKTAEEMDPLKIQKEGPLALRKQLLLSFPNSSCLTSAFLASAFSWSSMACYRVHIKDAFHSFACAVVQLVHHVDGVLNNDVFFHFELFL